MTVALSLLALSLLAEPAAASQAPAAPPAVGFEWDAPAKCPSPAEVEAIVEERLGAPLRTDGEDRLDVIARVREGEGGARWTMRLWFIDPSGTTRRDVADDDCRVLAQTAATMVAVFVEPETDPAPDPDPEPEPDPEPDPDPDPDPEPDPDPDPDPNPGPDPEPNPSAALGGDVRAHGHLDLGTLPRVGGGFTLAGNLDVRAARVELLLRGGFAGTIPIVGGGTASLSLWSAGVRAGWVPRWGKVELPLTAGLELGALTARAAQVPDARAGAIAWAAAVVSPTLVVRPVPRLGLWLGVEGSVNLLRPRIELDDGTRIHQPAIGGLRASLGISVRFGNTDPTVGRQRRGAGS